MVQGKVSEYGAFGHFLAYILAPDIKPTLQTPLF
jgi:hypothetical protein